MRRGSHHGLPAQRGFTYIGLLALIVLIGVFLAAAGQVAATTAQREREKDLLFAGHQYRLAIRSYYQRNRHYPQSLNELLGATATSAADANVQATAVPLRFLRRLYPDPMAPDGVWLPVPAPGGGIMGVVSASLRQPLKVGGFDDADQTFVDSKSYNEWQFVFDPRAEMLRNQQATSVPVVIGVR